MMLCFSENDVRGMLQYYKDTGGIKVLAGKGL